MIVFYCDECGRQIHITSPGVVHVDPQKTIVWGAPSRQGTYHFCSNECRREGAQKLIDVDYTAAPVYAFERELPVMVH